MEELRIVYLPPGELTPYAANAKKHPDDQVEHIANSIKEFGFRQPIVVDADNVVVIGHGRLLAAKKLGLDAVPVVRADDLTEAQIKALRLADNKTNESEWDFLSLEAELAELELDFDMSDFGFDDIPTITPDTEPTEEKNEVSYFEDSEIEQAIIDNWTYYENARDFAKNAIDKASAMYQFNRLCSGYNEGYNISALFNPHRFDTRTKKSESILSGWNNNPKYREQVARFIVRVKQQVPPKSQFFKFVDVGSAGYQYVNEFRPYLARDIYKKYVHEGDKVLNPCAGWGGRLIGFAACMFSDVEYVETDPATETYNGLVKLKDFLRLGDNVKQYNLPFEDLPVEDNYFDFVFTSPPYFDVERYSDEETQSYVRYNSLDTWKEHFFFPMVDKIINCMKPGASCLLNVGNVSYKLDSILENYLDSIGVKHKRIDDFKIGGNGIGERTGEGGEPFIFFRKG